MKRIFKLCLFSVTSLVFLYQGANAQQDSLRKDALNVFMEANDYLRKEIPFVNYVRDIKDAGVYIISTRQATGSGGREYTFYIVGQNEFEGMRDTITFFTSPDDTDDAVRIKEVNNLKMGLMRYIQKTPLSSYMRISFSQPLSETVSSDNWDSWVYRSSVNGYYQARKSRNSRYLSGSLSASRITEQWKINMSGRLNYDDSKYFINDTLTIFGEDNSKSFSSLIVKSLSDHWSLGGRVELGTSSYNNERYSYSVMPGIEYDLYPYSESTRRQLRLLYTVGYISMHYIDSTIYDKINENLWQHSIEAAYEVVQKWGNIDVGLSYSNYLHDWSKNNLSFSGSVELRIAKGLSINVSGSASLIHDQLGILKEDLSIEQILTQRKLQATNYSYYTSVGFTYTFGSIYNNVVNPRFGSSSGGSMIIIM